jgi:uncharacterized membrane protein YdjX (TVP38/TMEM64 family)
MKDPELHHSWSYTFRQLGPAGVLAIAWSVLPPVGSILVFWKIEAIAQWLRSHQEVGPYLFAAALTVLCGIGLLPTYASCAVGGWAFGFATGLGAGMVGFIIAALIGYLIARRVSGDHVLELIREHPKLEIIHSALLRASPRRTLLIIFLLRLAPNSPFALNNLLFGSTRVSLPLYMLGSLAGLLPRAAAVVYMASKLERLTPDFKENKLSIIVGILLTFGVLLAIGYIGKKALAQAMKMESEPQI